MVVETNLPEFHNDLCDVARLFPCDDLVIRHEADGWRDRVELYEGARCVAQRTRDAEETACGGLLAKRLRKRACKTALYELLKEYTGVRLPWGSLTGIRPTRLFQEGLAQGGADDAERRLITAFDVAPEKARLLRDIAAAQAEVPQVAKDECDVYVGIPFCPTRCSYCSFAAVGIQGASALVEPYLEALLREIRAGAMDVRAMGMRARAVYVGGGTPTTLSPERMDRLLALLRECFPEASEWTVEAGRPDAIDEARLAGLRARGVDRISVNPQTMNDRTLRAIGREHTAGDIERAMELVRAFGFPVVNMDLIAALPGEGAEDMQNTLSRVLAMGPQNVTVHTLAIKRASRLQESGEERPPAAEAARAVDLAAGTLREAGFLPYYLYRQKYMAGNLENVGYALPGAVCLYNVDNMEETTPILAFGAGAITKWLYPRERRIERAPNVRNIAAYIARVEEMAERKRGLWG